MKVSGVSRAAGVAYITPPAKSKAVQDLEFIQSLVRNARKNGEADVKFITQDDDVVRRVQNLYGDRVTVDASKSKRVTIRI